ncbi:MAG: DegV family EDD domain-containing protein, partial [Candidatus Heimdallarchaeota archaeon]|nr:DegV family EDD domain-containing protein [Candidatus Heimdallarchaeota archaeon]
DSSCDLPVEIIEEYDIGVVPVSIYFPDETRTQYIDISTEEFFKKIMEEDVAATTGVPAPKRFKEVFDRILAEYEEAIMLTLSKDLSGIWASSVLNAKNMTNNKVTVIDTRTTTLPFGLITLKVARMIRDGAQKETVLDRLKNDFIPKVRLQAFVGSLKYLKRSGRIDSLQHILGELFQFKPLITIEDGKLASHKRVRGDKATMEFLKNLGSKLLKNLPENETLIVIHSHNFSKAEELTNYLLERASKSLEILTWEIGPAIGVHVGPGAIGLTWIGISPDNLLE